MQSKNKQIILKDHLRILNKEKTKWVQQVNCNSGLLLLEVSIEAESSIDSFRSLKILEILKNS